MRFTWRFVPKTSRLIKTGPQWSKIRRFSLILLTASLGCTHAPVAPPTPEAQQAAEQATVLKSEPAVRIFGLKEIKLTAPVELLLKADTKHVEKVAYVHRSRSTSFEDAQVRHQKDEALDFTSQAETTNVEPFGGHFTQNLTILTKNGNMNLHDFAMPELGEKLEIAADSRGRILKAGDYPTNSIFYVSPISLPDAPVSVGDTWALQSDWLSLEEMVPYHLDMASILKAVYTCGTHRCAELEISGEVTLQGPLVQMMAFKSLWKGFILFDIDAGTVAWSRVDSEEQFASGNVRRSVSSCLEATLFEPFNEKLGARMAGQQEPCANLPEPGDIAPIPGSMSK